MNDRVGRIVALDDKPPSPIESLRAISEAAIAHLFVTWGDQGVADDVIDIFAAGAAWAIRRGAKAES